jgi:hypothetical protein
MLVELHGNSGPRILAMLVITGQVERDNAAVFLMEDGVAANLFAL